MSRRDEEDTLFPEAKGVAIGLVSGAVLGAVATLLLTTKTGEALCEACGDLKDSFTEQFTHNGKARSSDNINMIIGGIAASVLGISAILFLGSNAGKGIRKQVIHSFEKMSDKGHKMAHHFSDRAHETYENAEDQITSWVETAQDFLGKHSKRAEKHETMPEKALYWTLLGIRLYQSLKKER